MCVWLSTFQTYDKARNAVALALSPVVRALVDPDGAMRDIRNLDNVKILLISLVLFTGSLFTKEACIIFVLDYVNFLHCYR